MPTTYQGNGNHMTETLTKEDSFPMEEIVVSHAYEIMAMVSVLEKKGVLTRQEILDEITRMREK
jgi:hypothetical protein